MRQKLAIATAVIAAVTIGAGCGGSTDQSAQVAKKIGGDCTAETYEIISRLDGHHTRIYDCWIGAKEMCVTEEQGIARDQTAVVRFLFVGTLAGGKPKCLS